MSLKYLGQYDFRKTNSGGIRNMVIYNEKKTKMRKYSSNRMWRKYKKKKPSEKDRSLKVCRNICFSLVQRQNTSKYFLLEAVFFFQKHFEFLFVFWDRVSVCSFGWYKTYYVDPNGLTLIELKVCLFTFWVLNAF